jgi:translation initiation factor IF-2
MITGKPEYAVILAFDVKVDAEAQAHANEVRH